MVKNLEKICKNCQLFNSTERRCSVVILHEGEKINIPVDAEDACFFEEPYFNPITRTNETFNDIKEIKMWVEDEHGNKSDKGTVKIQYPLELEPQKYSD